MDHPNGSNPVYHPEAPSIDATDPELLSPEELDRHIAAVAAELTAQGFTVDDSDSRTNSDLKVENPADLATAWVYINHDRSGAYDLYRDFPEATSAQTATRIAYTLRPEQK